jgi:hypothetical protein
MAEAFFNTNESPEILVEVVDGDLRLSGWEHNEFQAETEGDDLRADYRDGRVTLKCHADCTIRIPRHSSLTVKRVNGNARLKALDNAAAIENVGGDLALRQTAGLTIGNVGGDLSAKKVAGPFAIKFVGGNLSVREVSGDFSADKVGGDLYLREASANARAGMVGADTILNLAFLPGMTYEFQSGGDLRCRVSLNLSAKFELQSGGDILVGVPGAKVDGNTRHKTVVLGEGAAAVKLRAGGDINLTTAPGDPDAVSELGDRFSDEFGVMAEELSAQIEAQVEAQMADLEKQLSERLGKIDSTFGGKFVNADEIAAKARRAAEKAAKSEARRAEKMAKAEARVVEAVRRRAESAERRAERRAERGKFGWTVDLGRAFAAPKPPAPPSEPVSDDERMLILKMVEQGKISVQEAEKLLSALEGKG